jgi:hypothetical protein
MKSYKLLSAPNVKINVGGNNDSTNKTNILNVEIVDAKDTFRKTINTDNVEEVIEELKSEIQSNHDVSDPDVEKMRLKKETMESALGIGFMFFIAILTLFLILYNKRQNRILQETMIKNGIDPTAQQNKISALPTDYSFGKGRMLKYAVVALSFGISYVADEFSERFFDIDCFWATFAILMGIGFLYIYKNGDWDKTKDIDTVIKEKQEEIKQLNP